MEFASHLLTDFSELKSSGHILRAKKLNENCKAICNEDVVCDNLTPGYFCGNIDSGVVMVNKKYQKDGGEGLLYKFEKLSKLDDEKTQLHGDGFSFKPSVSCTVWRATKTADGKHTDFVVASMFPNKALPNAYKAMKKYGEFCENTLKKYK